MNGDDILLDVEERMEKTIDGLKSNLAGIRTGRANPGLVDSLKVEVFGSAVPLKQLASVGAPDPTQIVIRAYDPSTLKEIEKTIQASSLGLNPQNDGRIIRLNVPALSADVRRNMVGRIHELREEAKVSIRNIRRDGNKKADQAEKDKTISEDQRDDVKKEIQDFTKDYESQADTLSKTREKDVTDA
ncbi:MAG: ribosome recycling factor [Planctomycetota bacterium]|nr:ribosome recycling factor [Planctomycetota bacterium]